MAKICRIAIVAFVLLLAGLIWPQLAGTRAGEVTATAQQDAPAAQVGPSATTAAEPTLEATVGLLHERLREVARNASDTLVDLDAAVAAEAHDKTSSGWLGFALADALLVVLVAGGFGEILARLLQRAWLHRFPATPASRIQTICFLATRAIAGLTASLLIAIIGFIAANAIAGEDPPTYMTVMVAVLTAAVLRALLTIAANLIVADRPSYRLLAFGDTEARRLWRGFVPAATLCALALGFAAWVAQLPLDPDAFRLVHVVATFIAMVTLATFVVHQRRPIANALVATRTGPAPAWRRILAGVWHLIALAYLVSAWVVSSVRVLLGQSGGIGLVTSPLGIILVAAALYGVALILIDAAFRNAQTPIHHYPDGRPLPTFQDLAEHAAAIAVTIAAFAMLFHLWNVAIFDIGRTAGSRFFEIILIVLLAYLTYQATKITIDRRLLTEMDGQDVAGDEGDAHSAASRLATLLHLFRGFALTTIVVMAVMVGLSEIGINIGPLFAGAGVVGLAIGFGAQTLIRDIFSGAFFLIDDAFRRGEYIDVGVAKGTVERISIRSIQLRHHNGPLDTVPFGVIRNVRNFSRDWVIMKLPLRLRWDADIDMVRRIIKKISAEIAADPEHGPKLLEPVKSQGVYETDESAMIVRVKFMTRPGDQFVIRRLVYAKVQEHFARNGINFASREVMVRVANPSSPADDAYAAGAAAPLLAATRFDGETATDGR